MPIFLGGVWSHIPLYHSSLFFLDMAAIWLDIADYRENAAILSSSAISSEDSFL